MPRGEGGDGLKLSGREGGGWRECLEEREEG